MAVIKYELRFSVTHAFGQSFCSNYAFLTFTNPATIDYPKSDAKPAKLDVTAKLGCKVIG